MRILVTGGKGTLGRPLCDTLRSRGHEVVSADVVHAPDEMGFSLRPDAVKPTHARCDVAEYRQLERVVESMGPFEMVFHSAAEFGRWNGEDFYESLWRSNVVGTKNVIRLQEKHRFRLVHFSSSEVYGDWPELMVESVTESHEIKQLNDYAMTKWVNEMQIRNAGLLHGTESVVIRMFNVYGPGEYYSPYRSVNCRFVYCALARLPWVVFRGHKRTSTYLADAVRTIANIADSFRAGETYNIGGNESHSIEELSDLVVDVTGAPRELVRYQESELLTTRVKNVDVSKAVSELSHQTTVPLAEGIRRTAEWMRQVYGFR